VTYEQVNVDPAVLRRLSQAGYRITQPRQAILQVLHEHDEGLSPEELHRLGQRVYPPLGLVTVYRTLDLLDELGLVRRVHSEERCQRYASAVPEQHYLVCSVCHRVLEFPCGGLDPFIKEVQARTGYRVTEHLLELRGICPACQDAGAHATPEPDAC
jgi:Fur family ferric uptake transcriptional regulator